MAIKDEEKTKAHTERYRAQTRVREKNGGAGFSVKFYDLNVNGKNVKVKRRLCNGKKR